MSIYLYPYTQHTHACIGGSDGEDDTELRQIAETSKASFVVIIFHSRARFYAGRRNVADINCQNDESRQISRLLTARWSTSRRGARTNRMQHLGQQPAFSCFSCLSVVLRRVIPLPAVEGPILMLKQV
jgi:hypothetical protein